MSGSSRYASQAIASTVVVALVLLPFFASAEQSTRILALVVTADRLKNHIPPLRKALRNALGAKRVWFLPEDLDCDPESDTACASSLMTKNRATAIVIVRVQWVRAGCRQSYDSNGKVTGHRALRRPQVQVIAISKGQAVERVTLSKSEASLEDGIADALKTLAAKHRF